MKSKTIILSSQKKFINNSPRAIVTFITDNKKTEGKLRLYNLDTLPSFSKLGIYYENQVYTANLVKKDGAFSFYLDENFNLDNNIYCAIIDKGNNNDVVLFGGTSNNFVYSVEEPEEDDKIEEENIVDEEDEKIIDDNIKKIEEKHDKNTNISEENQKNPTDKNCEDCGICENCVYKDYFYSHHKKNEDVEDEPHYNLKPSKDENDECQIQETNNDLKVNELSNSSNVYAEENNLNQVDTLNKESEKFLQLITDQLDDMFKTYPEDDVIMKIIPNSKIIKVTDTIDQSPYILGVIYENGEIKYLLYGVPCKYNDTPPKELGENYQWLPLNTDDPMSDGYYLLYQDASSGKIVPIIVE